MRKTTAFTIVELLVVMGIVTFLALMAAAMASKRDEVATGVSCEYVMYEVARAMVAYTHCNGDYYPFSTGPAYLGEREQRSKDSMTSLAALYPEHIQSAGYFRCNPDRPVPYFIVNAPVEVTANVKDANGSGTIDPEEVVGTRWERAYMRERNFTLMGSHYGYDCRISPRVSGTHAIYGDMDGTWESRPDAPTQNHRRGQNILFADGHIAWRETNFGSNDPEDNIYAEDKADSDIDAFLSDNTDPARPGDYRQTNVNLKLRPLHLED